MNISQAAKKSGLPVKTVRYYADIALVEPHRRSEAGYRIYDEGEVARLTFVRRARSFDFSIEQCRELLALYDNNHRASADVKQIAEKRLSEIEQKQLELQKLHDQLAALVAACKGDGEPACPIMEFLG